MIQKSKNINIWINNNIQSLKNDRTFTANETFKIGPHLFFQEFVLLAEKFGFVQSIVMDVVSPVISKKLLSEI